MNEENRYIIIKRFIEILTEVLVQNSHIENINEKLINIFLTGSIISQLESKKIRMLPDINYYLLIRGTGEDIILFHYLLHKSIIEATRIISNNMMIKVNVMLDLHPFSISYNKPIFKENIINIQLTTRAINVSQKNLYPDYSWYGWYLNHIILYPENGNDILKTIPISPPNRDIIWLRNMYLALLSYGNVLQILPLYSLDKEHLFYETYKYLKEMLKDGIALALTNQEFQEGKLHKILHGNWVEKIVSFYEERYGNEATEIVEQFVKIEEDYFSNVNVIDPLWLLRQAFKLRDILFNKGFMARLREFSVDGRMLEEMLNSLPLWW